MPRSACFSQLKIWPLFDVAVFQAYGLSFDQHRVLVEVFKAADRDSDGLLGRSDLSFVETVDFFSSDQIKRLSFELNEIGA